MSVGGWSNAVFIASYIGILMILNMRWACVFWAGGPNFDETNYGSLSTHKKSLFNHSWILARRQRLVNSS